jgi:hypothetical protein
MFKNNKLVKISTDKGLRDPGHVNCTINDVYDVVK